MITKIRGQLAERSENSVVINVGGIFYEVIVPESVLVRLDEHVTPQGEVELITYYYFQISPSSGMPVLIGFLNEIERDFFQQFIKVSGIGPRAAVKALNQPISQIARAIDQGDQKFLKTLPGIGEQKAKEIIAKLQGKVGRYGLIQDQDARMLESTKVSEAISAWQEEALEVLLQLQYKRPEAMSMLARALERNTGITTAEDLLNEIYKQRIAK